MPVTDKAPAPYGPHKLVLDVMTRYRDGRIIAPITYDVLERIGFSPTAQKRVLASLKGIDLVDDEGKPTPEFDKIAHAPSNEYQSVLAGHLNEVYAEVLTLVDPAKATYEEVFDAFRRYKPTSVRNRMVSLFLALCEEAGIVDEVPQPDRTPSNNSTRGTRKSGSGNSKNGQATLPKSPPPPPGEEERRSPPKPDVPGISSLHPALSGFLADLPKLGVRWTAEERAVYLKAFNALLDVYYPAKPHQRGGQATMFDSDEGTA